MNGQGPSKRRSVRAIIAQLVFLSLLFCDRLEAEYAQQADQDKQSKDNSRVQQRSTDQPKIFPIKVTQGVAVDEAFFYALSNTSIDKCDKQTGQVIATWKADKKIATQKHFKHLNSGMVIEDKLYAAHSRFPIAPNDCSVEVFDVTGEKLEHVQSIRMPSKHGSLTWVDRRDDDSWWMCYAVYGKANNQQTKLIKYRYDGADFSEVESYFFPAEVVAKWGSMSCSGGSWGPDGLLYTTGHDHAQAYVLEVDKEASTEADTDLDNRGGLKYLRTEKDTGFYGQGIAWDRFVKAPLLWGIVKNKKVSVTKIAEIK